MPRGRNTTFGLYLANRGGGTRSNVAWEDILDIAYQTEALRQLCISKKAATKKLGALTAEQLANRLADLRAAVTVDDLLVGLRPQATGAEGEMRVLDLDHEKTIVFAAQHLTLPRLPSKRVDWTKVTRVKIIAIG